MNKKLIINILAIVFSVKMLVISVLIFTWDRTQPPYHLVPDMDDQPRMKAQDADSTTGHASTYMFQPPHGVVANGHLQADSEYYLGLSDPSDVLSFISKIPVKVDVDLLNRGQERFDKFCTACHDKLGTGQGKVMPFATAFAAVIPNFHWDGKLSPAKSFKGNPVREMDGHIFSVITNGKGAMFPLGDQIPVADRWAIVAYVRALQQLKGSMLIDDGTHKEVDLAAVRVPNVEGKGK